MANHKDLQRWMEKRDIEDDRLYERFGKPLQKDHTDEYVAIGPDGTKSTTATGRMAIPWSGIACLSTCLLPSAPRYAAALEVWCAECGSS